VAATAAAAAATAQACRQGIAACNQHSHVDLTASCRPPSPPGSTEKPRWLGSLPPACSTGVERPDRLCSGRMVRQNRQQLLLLPQRPMPAAWARLALGGAPTTAWPSLVVSPRNFSS